jgi:hypothetical protein
MERATQVDQSRISARAQDRLQSCLVIGSILLALGIVIILFGVGAGIIVAAVGQAVLVVGLVGFGVKLGVEAAASPKGESSRVE